MSARPEQLGHWAAFRWRRAAIGALAAMVVSTIILYLPFGKWTLVLAAGLIVFLWVFSREFGIWCQSMAATCLGAVTVLNVPTVTLLGTWGDAAFGAKLEGQDWIVSISLVLASIGFAILAYLYRRIPASDSPTTAAHQPIVTAGDHSPVAGRDQVIAKGDAAGRDLNKTGFDIENVQNINVAQASGAHLKDETLNAVIEQQLKAISEKDDRLESLAVQLTEKDELVARFKEGLARAQRKAEQGLAAAEDALQALRESNDTEKLQRVLEAEADGSKADFIERCLEISAVAFLRGDIDTARSRVQDVLALDANELRALNQQGHIEALLGNIDAAEAAYRHILDAGEDTENPELVAVGAGNLGIILTGRGDLDGADAMYRKSLAINEKLGRLEGMASTYSNFGVLLKTRGDLDGAEAMHRKSLAIEEKLGRLEGMAITYSNLGTVLTQRGDLEGAEALHRKSLAIEEKLGRLEGMASDYGNLGIIVMKRGDLKGAETMHRKSLAIEEKLGRVEGMAEEYGNLGIILRRRGDLDGADAMLRKALEINEKLGRLVGMAKQYGNLGNVLGDRGDLDGAEAMYRKALKINKELGQLEGMGNDYANLGILFKLRGNVDAAREHWEKARVLFERIGMPHMVEKVEGWLDGLPEADRPA